MPFEWSSDITKRLADPRCDCWGQGTLKALDGETVPCVCALRAIYRIVMTRFERAYGDSAGRIRNTIRRHGTTYSRDNEDFLIDVQLCAKRALTVTLYQSFQRFLDGVTAPPETIAHLESTLGRAFAETALWPLDRYFGTPPSPRRRTRRRRQKPALAV